MNLKVSENIYGQYLYIFSVVSCTVAGRSKTSSSSSRENYYGGGGSYDENHKRSSDEADLKNASGEFQCTLEMIFD